MESLKEVALEKDSIVNCDETLCKVRKYDHARAKFVKAREQAGDKNADIFIKSIEALYDLERQYTRDGLTDED